MRVQEQEIGPERGCPKWSVIKKGDARKVEEHFCSLLNKDFRLKGTKTNSK